MIPHSALYARVRARIYIYIVVPDGRHFHVTGIISHRSRLPAVLQKTVHRRHADAYLLGHSITSHPLRQ